MPASRRLQSWVVPLLFGGALLTFVGVGWREVTDSSTFQLFGDYVARVETTAQVVALTFDDGPHPQNTPRILDLLDKYDVKATFFMMGRNVERFPDVTRQVIARGHEVGNHSYSHPKLVWMSPGAVRDEIDRTDRLLREAGVTGPIHFRPPHAAKFVVLPHVLRQTRRLSVLGDVDVEEWKGHRAEVMVAAALSQVRPGSIIGFHDVLGAETAKTVDAVVPELQRRGYAFERISELIRRRAP
jgi:peptidoglycan-N-acetylglucosamine deacetylase